jgi:bacterioferritin (cytochrome b1)
MDRDLLVLRLAQAERAVELGFELIAEQRAILHALEAWGQDSTVARRHLLDFEAIQERHIDDLETAQTQLAAADYRQSA